MPNPTHLAAVCHALLLSLSSFLGRFAGRTGTGCKEDACACMPRSSVVQQTVVCSKYGSACIPGEPCSAVEKATTYYVLCTCHSVLCPSRDLPCGLSFFQRRLTMATATLARRRQQKSLSPVCHRKPSTLGFVLVSHKVSRDAAHPPCGNASSDTIGLLHTQTSHHLAQHLLGAFIRPYTIPVDTLCAGPCQSIRFGPVHLPLCSTHSLWIGLPHATLSCTHTLVFPQAALTTMTSPGLGAMRDSKPAGRGCAGR